MSLGATAAGAVLAAGFSSDAGLWTDLLEVILYGAVAGVGIAIAFSMALRGLILGGVARRDGRGGTAALHLVSFAAFAVVCIGSVVVALASILHR